jgi:hypothetical protein
MRLAWETKPVIVCWCVRSEPSNVVVTRTENKNPRLILFLYWAQPSWPTNKQARGLSIMVLGLVG